METHRHQIPELRSRDIQRHRLPVRPLEQHRWVRQAELRKAERKAANEECKKAEMAMALVGIAMLNEIVKAITKPNEPAPIPAPTSPLKSDETIIDAEFIDVVEETETNALVTKS